jgi:hypothetical protein
MKRRAIALEPDSKPVGSLLGITGMGVVSKFGNSQYSVNLNS